MVDADKRRERFTTRVESEGVTLTVSALRADIRLYFDVPFDEIADDFLPVHDDLWSWLGRARFNWWRNENMSTHVRMHHATHTTLHVALRRAQPKSVGYFTAKGVDLALGESGAFAAADVAITAQWHTRGGAYFGSSAGVLRALDRIERMCEDPAAWRDRVIALCDALPVKSGVAGFAVERGGLDYADMTALFGAAMRHPGADMDNDWEDALAPPNAIKGVNWLTVVGNDGVAELGGEDAVRAALDPAIKVFVTRHALVIQAGDAPALGDVNRGDRLPLYRAVYAVVQPLHERMIEGATAFQMGRDDDDDRTADWLRRFQ